MTPHSLDPLARQESRLVTTQEGFAFRDLNKNGKLDIYEDPRQPLEARVEDLLSQMTLAEKAGTLFINGAAVNEDGSIEEKAETGGWAMAAPPQMTQQQMTHFNLWMVPGPGAVATWNNNLQRFAEQTRLGIPVSIASDPRNHFTRNIFAMQPNGFSQWCEPVGFGAIGDPAVAWQYADLARQEYLAVGIRIALHPQIDLATEPRWPRISGTFGEDAQMSAVLVRAYIAGFQGAELGAHSVACMTKHFPGGGPQNQGLDPHFDFQRGQVYPGNNFDYHLIPFEAAFEAGTAAIMPYYGVPMGQTDEDVAMSYNKAIITGLLRGKYGYEGVVCTDWGLVSDVVMPGFTWPARAWGVEHLSRAERVKKALEAGVDQFGGESCPELVVELVENGLVSEGRIDQSVRRLLKLKFELGLFDNPFVDEAKIPLIFGNPAFTKPGEASQRRAMTLLKNEAGTLPLRGRPKLYVKNLDAALAAEFGELVDTPEAADFAILRLETPFYPVDTSNLFALSFHHGDLDFKGEALEEVLRLLKSVPTIVSIYLDRPAVIPEISAAARALLGEFGASDRAILEVVFGQAEPQGRLPFELPSSMEAVRGQKEDLPHDSQDPLYPFGFGLRV
jgi:beta-glucosidase